MTINCHGQLIDLTSPKVMGILNVTPNSFYDGNRYNTERLILNQVEKMLVEGATFIDVGVHSSKPNADLVSSEEEAIRLIPVLKAILQHFPETILSVDTFRSEIAKIGLDHGAAIINDISAGALDKNMFKVVAEHRVPYVMMHMRGTPKTMNSLTQYEAIVNELIFYFSERIALARSFGIIDLIIDPGFGFAKTMDQNYEVLQKLELFQNLDLPILVGVSRKSMVYKPINATAEEALNGTSVLNTIALTKGASILRVHDVKEAVECIKLYEKLQR
jgi:dihydropteroate synthase